MGTLRQELRIKENHSRLFPGLSQESLGPRVQTGAPIKMSQHHSNFRTEGDCILQIQDLLEDAREEHFRIA